MMILRFRHFFLPFVLLLSSFEAGSQNLIYNGGFEIYNELPDDMSQIYKADGWSNPNQVYDLSTGTPDFYHTEGSVPVFYDPIAPNSGNGQAGMIVGVDILEIEGREYITSQLTEPLVPNQVYQLSFYLSSGVGTNLNCNNLGVHLSEGSLVQNEWLHIDIEPLVEITDIVYNPYAWVEYVFYLSIDYPADHFTFGNFRSEDETDFGPNDLWFEAYYFIDDIELIAWNPPIEIVGDTLICHGEEITLEAVNDSVFSWATMDEPDLIISESATLTVSPEITTTYNVYGTSDTASITVEVLDEIEQPTLVFIDGELVASAGDSYEWYLNGNLLPDFVDQAITPVDEGSYTVTVTIDGCNSEASVPYVFIPDSITELEAVFSVWPNPVQDLLYFESQEAGILKIYDMTGKLMLSWQVAVGVNAFDTSELDSGTYVGRFEGALNFGRFRVLKE